MTMLLQQHCLRKIANPNEQDESTQYPKLLLKKQKYFHKSLTEKSACVI